MKMSSICAMGCLLVAFGASATGVMPILDLDFTRSANETLKKLGINDACIIRAQNPVAFTYCREGSSTLWKYQDLDLAQLAAVKNDGKLPLTAYQRISVVEFNSAICEQETAVPVAQSTVARSLVFGLLALSVLLGLRYTWQVILPRRRDLNALSVTGLPPMSQTPPRVNSSKKAAAAFGIAVAVAFVCFGCLGF
ncbi:hypothetical protein C4E44_16005 [Pseudomonas sp. MWU12-2312b]|nr:hypothetical protein [Pseudomonas moorei]PPA03093.1 hypothetical protein C4E44_16005 [Pseudomonas sp. MWU12-2312b]